MPLVPGTGKRPSRKVKRMSDFQEGDFIRVTRTVHEGRLGKVINPNHQGWVIVKINQIDHPMVFRPDELILLSREALSAKERKKTE